MDLELSVFVAFVVVVNGLLIFAISRVGRRKTGRVTYYPPENRFTQEQGVKAYRLTHDEWTYKLASQSIPDWKMMLLDLETLRVLAVSTEKDDVGFIREYLKEVSQHEIPAKTRRLAVVSLENLSNALGEGNLEAWERLI